MTPFGATFGGVFVTGLKFTARPRRLFADARADRNQFETQDNVRLRCAGFRSTHSHTTNTDQPRRFNSSILRWSRGTLSRVRLTRNCVVKMAINARTGCQL